MGRTNLKLSDETGEETRDALKRYRDAHDLSSHEEAIRHLLPDWTFNPLIGPKMGRLIEGIDESRHFDMDVSEIDDVDELADILESQRYDSDFS